MNHSEKARQYAARIRWLLEEARRDGLAFTVTGGRRSEYRLSATVLPHTLELDEPAQAGAAAGTGTDTSTNQEGN